MGVSEIPMGIGQWSMQLRADTPQAVINQIGYFGHIAITTSRVNPALVGDGLLRTARYVGVVMGLTRGGSSVAGTAPQPSTIGGPGMAFWLGDADDKGSVFETAVSLSAASFHTAIPLLLPSSGAVTAGFISTSVPGTLTQSYQWVSPRTAISGVCQLMGGAGSSAAEWRVNNDATLDAGLVSELYATVPVAAITRRQSGADTKLRALYGSIQNAADVTDYTTRSVVLAGATPTVGAANLGSVPYTDLHGNTVKLTRVTTQPSTAAGNAGAAASAVLALYNAPRNAVALSSGEYDIKGVINAGDYVWVQDPDSGLYDVTQEVHLRGEVLNPVLMRCVELDWPIVTGYGAAYRNGSGAWIDLSDYLVPEAGPTTIVVGSTARPLIPA
jgi:hypothetical protein